MPHDSTGRTIHRSLDAPPIVCLIGGQGTAAAERIQGEELVNGRLTVFPGHQQYMTGYIAARNAGTTRASARAAAADAWRARCREYIMLADEILVIVHAPELTDNDLHAIDYASFHGRLVRFYYQEAAAELINGEVIRGVVVCCRCDSLVDQDSNGIWFVNGGDNRCDHQVAVRSLSAFQERSGGRPGNE